MLGREGKVAEGDELGGKDCLTVFIACAINLDKCCLGHEVNYADIGHDHVTGHLTRVTNYINWVAKGRGCDTHGSNSLLIFLSV